MVKETGFGLVRFSKKSGKVDTCMSAMGTAMLSLWGLQNTTKTKITAIFDLEDGKVIEEYEGNEDFPKVVKNPKWTIDTAILEGVREDYSRA